MNDIVEVCRNDTLPTSPIATGIDRDFLSRKAPELAYDIAIGLDIASNLARSYGLSSEQWDALRQWPAFRGMVQAAAKEASGASGARDRIRRKAESMLENVVLMDLGVLLGDAKVSAAVKVDAANTISSLAGMGKGSPAPTAVDSGQPLIIINVGGKENTTVSVGGSPE